MADPTNPAGHTCPGPYTCSGCERQRVYAYACGRRDQLADDRAHVADLLASLLDAHADLAVRWRRVAATRRRERIRNRPRLGDFDPAGWPTEDVKRWVREGV